MKTKDEILLETHGDRDYNYNDIKRAMHLWGKQILVSKLPKNLRELYDNLSTNYVSAKELFILTGQLSKSITTQLKQLDKNYSGLIEFKREGKLYYWRKSL